jgi:GAF domain-containing protein
MSSRKLRLDRAARAQHTLAEERAHLQRVNAVLALLHSLSDGLSRTHTSAQVADVILSRGRAALGASAGSLYLADEAGAELHLVRAVGYPEARIQAHQLLAVSAALPLAEAFRRGSGLFSSRGDASAGTRPFAAVPLVVEGRCLGTLGFRFL